MDWDGKLPPDEIWILIDTSNGRDGGKNYCWWFRDLGAAKEYKKYHDSNPNFAKLIGPYPYRLDLVSDDIP